MNKKSNFALVTENRELRAVVRELVALPHADDRLTDLQKKARDLLEEQDRRSRNLGFKKAEAQRAATAKFKENAAERRRELEPIVKELWEQGHTLRAIAAEMMRRGLKTPKGKDNWEAGTVRNLLPNDATRT